MTTILISVPDEIAAAIVELHEIAQVGAGRNNQYAGRPEQYLTDLLDVVIRDRYKAVTNKALPKKQEPRGMCRELPRGTSQKVTA